MQKSKLLSGYNVFYVEFYIFVIKNVSLTKTLTQHTKMIRNKVIRFFAVFFTKVSKKNKVFLRAKTLFYNKNILISKSKPTMKLTAEQIKKIKAYFKTQPVLKAYLFGSYVRDEATKESDVDILVDLDYSQPVGLEFIQMKIDLQNLLSKNVDLVSSRGLSKYIKPYIDSEKVMIYAR